MEEQDDQQRQESHRECHVMIAHSEAEDEEEPDKGILPVGPPDPDIGEHQEDHHQADMQRVESLPDHGMGPDGGYPDEGQRGGNRENGCWQFRHTEPACCIQRDQREDSGSGGSAETREEIDLPGAVAEGDDVAPDACENRPEGITRGVHHPPMKGRGGHFPIVVEADVRHHGRPIGHERDQGAKECRLTLMSVEHPEGVNPLFFLVG